MPTRLKLYLLDSDAAARGQSFGDGHSLAISANLHVRLEEFGTVGKERLMSHPPLFDPGRYNCELFALCSKRDSHPKPAWPSD